MPYVHICVVTIIAVVLKIISVLYSSGGTKGGHSIATRYITYTAVCHGTPQCGI